MIQTILSRVLNVLRHWVDYHFYDFETDPSLLDRLTIFLESVKSKSMKKWVDSITKIIYRKVNEEPRVPTYSHNKSPPSPEVHLMMDDKDWEFTNVGTDGSNEVSRMIILLSFYSIFSLIFSARFGPSFAYASSHRDRSPTYFVRF